MNQKRILVVDDDSAMRRAMLMILVQNGYDVCSAEHAEAAFQRIGQWQPNLILLDIGLPGMDGLEAFQRFRQTVSASIIFVTSHRRELDEVIGLEMGADDYITKPFSMDVLLSRVKTALRHSHALYPETARIPISVGDIALDPHTFCATLGDQPLPLTPREFDLLLHFATHANAVISVEDILMDVWGEEWVGENQTVYVHVCSLRKKIEANPVNPQRLLTIRGIGYKFVPQVAQ